MEASKNQSGRLKIKGATHKAYKVLLKLLHPTGVNVDKGIPLFVLRQAKGIAFITSLRGGFVFSGTLGTGIVIAKLDDGSWSGPSSLGTAGMGGGLLIGLSSTDAVIILNNDFAVRAFSGRGHIKLGGNISLAAGPIGRDVAADVRAGDGGVAACYSYSHSRGVFAGLSLQGSILFARNRDNKEFYGGRVTPLSILSGLSPVPNDPDVIRLHETLKQICFGGHSAVYSGLPMPEYSSDKSEPDSSAQAATGVQSGVSSFMPNSSNPVDLYSDNGSTCEGITKGGQEWHEVISETGVKYYWNEHTNEMTLICPDSLADTAGNHSIKNPQSNVEASSLAASWQLGMTSSGARPTEMKAPNSDLTSLPVNNEYGPYSFEYDVPNTSSSFPTAAPYSRSTVNLSPSFSTSQSYYGGSALPSYPQAQARPTISIHEGSIVSPPTTRIEMGNIEPTTFSMGPRDSNASFREFPPVYGSNHNPVSIETSQIPGRFFSYEQVKNRAVPGLNAERLETYLSDADFECVFGIDRRAFTCLPNWQQIEKKRVVGLY